MDVAGNPVARLELITVHSDRTAEMRIGVFGMRIQVSPEWLGW